MADFRFLGFIYLFSVWPGAEPPAKRYATFGVGVGVSLSEWARRGCGCGKNIPSSKSS